MVIVVNVCLMGWALFLHSASPWEGTWLMLGPVYHNKHHEAGIRNGNYSAIFKIFDRLFGTLREAESERYSFWVEADKARLLKDAAAAGKAAGGTAKKSARAAAVDEDPQEAKSARNRRATSRAK